MKRKFFVWAAILATLLSACGSAPSGAPADTGPVQTAAVATYMAAQQPANPTLTIDQRVEATVQAMAPAGQPPATSAAPAATNAPVVNSGDTSAYEGTATCVDGKNTTPLFFEQPTDVPWGTKDGAVIAQIAWKPGDGFAGWFRIVAIAERILGIEMPYANNILTLYVTQYCGALVDIKNEARNHVTAMVNSAQNSAGDRPSPDEIPIVLLKRDGSIEWVVQAPNGPSLAEIQAHLEMRP